MPTTEQMLYAQWILVRSTMEYIRDNIEDTLFEDLNDLMEALIKGADVADLRMKGALKEDDCDYC